jgi:hypothetical protein
MIMMIVWLVAGVPPIAAILIRTTAPASKSKNASLTAQT